MINKKMRFLIDENRVGIAKRLVDVFTKKNMNICKMEINPPHISVELEASEEVWEDFEVWISKEIKQIVHIKELQMLDFERRATELQTIINNMRVGLVAVNDKGKILYYNSKASRLFNIGEEDIRKDVNQFIPLNIYNPEVDLNDKMGIEFSGKLNGKEANGIIDILNVKGNDGKKIGSLIHFREMDEVRKLMNTISRPSMNTFEEILGESESILRTKELAKSVAKTESNVIVLGESGTGKELFARAIHMESNRRKGPFVAVNCSAVPESLMESEFFGYEKGSFTGASKSGKQGLFELAKGGSLFLDEIGDLPIHLQAKILRAIQEKKIRRIGGDKEIAIDARIISATHRDLKEMVEEKTFREDLYYRLTVVPVIISPLRERTGDIELIANKFVKSIGEDMDRKDLKIDDEVMSWLKSYSWPGNIRELQNVIERAIIFTETNTITMEDIIVQESHKLNIEERFDKAKDSKIDFPVNLPELIRSMEYRYILEASEEFSSSREIAKALGISHTTVINRLNNM